MEMIATFIHRAVMQGIPLLYGSTGEIITEKSGNLNLGVPGMMYMGGIAGLTYGTLKGVCFIVVRVGVGLTDIVTFPIPLPNCPDNPDGYGPGYGPIMRPAWVIDANHDWQNFVYPRTSTVSPLN
jgi:putative exosortase-associated protein (TIGR04073 family)